ncbi:MAG: winged helix-turn-helix domain-containing protein [Candidatus Nitrosocaldaceae archaeon]
MNSIKRDRLDIMIDILEIVSTLSKKTHILYKANVNYTQLTKYLTALQELGMLHERDGEYVITDKGRIFLSLMKKSAIIEH